MTRLNPDSYDYPNSAYQAACDTIGELKAELAARDAVLTLWLDAMETGRSEPLFNARNATRNLLADAAEGAPLPTEGEQRSPFKPLPPEADAARAELDLATGLAALGMDPQQAADYAREHSSPLPTEGPS